MKQKNIEQQKPEQVDTNIYKIDQDYYVKHDGELKTIDSITNKTLLNTITKGAYKKYVDNPGIKPNNSNQHTQQNNTIHQPTQQTQHNNTTLPMNPGIVTPMVNVDQIVQNMNTFNNLKSQLLNENDIMYIGKDGKPTINKKQGKPYIKKSGWRKLALAFNLNCEILNKNQEKNMNNGEDYYKWIYFVRVTAPNGRYQDAEGICTSKDPFFTKGGKQEADEANVMMKAQTVAFNRAISDLIGGGETSAEELS